MRPATLRREADAKHRAGHLLQIIGWGIFEFPVGILGLFKNIYLMCQQIEQLAIGDLFECTVELASNIIPGRHHLGAFQFFRVHRGGDITVGGLKNQSAGQGPAGEYLQQWIGPHQMTAKNRGLVTIGTHERSKYRIAKRSIHRMNRGKLDQFGYFDSILQFFTGKEFGRITLH